MGSYRLLDARCQLLHAWPWTFCTIPQPLIRQPFVKTFFVITTRSPKAYFLQKWEELRGALRKPVSSNLAIGQDYRRALKLHLPETDLVYADPPYSFVHYSRFYHALETLVRYDYPASDTTVATAPIVTSPRSAFKTKVKKAFQDIILPVAEAQKKLVISYSNTGMITLGDLRKECEIGFGKSHVQLISSDYMHATMGRRGDKHREVKELLIVCRV